VAAVRVRGSLASRLKRKATMTLVPIPARASSALVSFALLACAASNDARASSHIVDVAWSADGRFAHTARVVPGKFVELCGKLDHGAAVRWTFDASAPVDFNIHYHVGKDVVFPAKLAQTAWATDVLQVAVAQDYCWMWANNGPRQVELRVTLAR
jgi:hypothetical protein